MPPGCILLEVTGHVQLVEDPEQAGEIIYLIWFGNALGSSRRNWKTLLGGGTSELPTYPAAVVDSKPYYKYVSIISKIHLKYPYLKYKSIHCAVKCSLAVFYYYV